MKPFVNIAEALTANGSETAEAVIYGDTKLTYGELRARVLRIAHGLLDLGYSKGVRVGLLSENSPFFVIAYLGIIRAGLTAVPIQNEVSAEGLMEIAANARLGGMFVSNRLLKRAGPRIEQTGVRILTEQFEAHAKKAPKRLFPEIDARHDLAALMFTSGSSGSPKGVMVTHRNIECNTLDILSYLGLGPHDRSMVVLPFHYCFGLSLLHSHLMAGGALVLNNEFRLFPEATLMEMRQKECTGFAGVPSTFQILLLKSRFASLAFPHLRWLQQAGGKLPDHFILELQRAVPNAKLYIMYGQTEATARLSYLPPERLANKLGSIGRGLPSARLEVLKADGKPVTPGSDEVGEIVATGDNVALGYWGDPAETAKCFRNGKLHTGDTARVDAEGFIYIVGREREIIKTGGNRVSAKEIEDVIGEHPEVAEVAVLSAPHELLGEAIKAFATLVPKSTLTARDLERFCRERLPAYKVPEEVILLNEMAHNSAGKILKPELRKMLEVRRSGEIRNRARTGAEVCSA